jgi:hypothetical protein
MFGEYQSIMIFCQGLIKMAHSKKIKLSFGMHPQLINMDLQEGMVYALTFTHPKKFTQSHGSVFDKYLHCPHAM